LLEGVFKSVTVLGQRLLEARVGGASVASSVLFAVGVVDIVALGFECFAEEFGGRS
jgi:hypothetical protein